jgi:hypothetical protein
MATKVKLLKLLQEMRGFSEFHHYHPTAKSSSLYLLQLRSHVAQTSHAKRRLVITVDLKDSATLPHPVKINHLKQAPLEEVCPLS